MFSCVVYSYFANQIFTDYVQKILRSQWEKCGGGKVCSGRSFMCVDAVMLVTLGFPLVVLLVTCVQSHILPVLLVGIKKKIQLSVNARLLKCSGAGIHFFRTKLYFFNR